MVRSQQLDGYIETSAMTESDQVATVFEEAARLALGKEPQFMPEDIESRFQISELCNCNSM